MDLAFHVNGTVKISVGKTSCNRGESGGSGKAFCALFILERSVGVDSSMDSRKKTKDVEGSDSA